MPRSKGPAPKYVSLPPTIGISNHDPTKEQAPGYSFVSRRSQNQKSTPGPYFIESGLTNKGINTRAGPTLKGRPKQDIWGNKEETPGPSFNPSSEQASIGASAPRFSFGTPRKTNYKKPGPGPNQYNIPSSFGQARKATLLGRNGAKSFSYDFAKSPGPAYNINNNNMASGPSFSLGPRLKYRQKTITPGPDYNPVWNGNVPNSPRFSIGIKYNEEVIPLADVTE